MIPFKLPKLTDQKKIEEHLIEQYKKKTENLVNDKKIFQSIAKQFVSTLKKKGAYQLKKKVHGLLF